MKPSTLQIANAFTSSTLRTVTPGGWRCCTSLLERAQRSAGRVQMHLRCEDCNNELAPTQITTGPGPGVSPGQFD
jgi:hypothetical protein